MREKTLLEVAMMLGDAIDKLNALSAYKDPYAHLKEAQERGEVIQFLVQSGTHGDWQDVSYIDTDVPPDRYRIKPKTKTLYKWAYMDKVTRSWRETDRWMESESDFLQDYLWVQDNFHRLDYTAIEVEA